jgi:hypothetical protein
MEAVVCVIKVLPVGHEEKHESPLGRVADLESPQYKDRLLFRYSGWVRL